MVKQSKRDYPKSRKEIMHEYDPLIDEVGENIEEENLNQRDHERAQKPRKGLKKRRSGPKEGYGSLHR